MLPSYISYLFLNIPVFKKAIESLYFYLNCLFVVLIHCPDFEKPVFCLSQTIVKPNLKLVFSLLELLNNEKSQSPKVGCLLVFNICFIDRWRRCAFCEQNVLTVDNNEIFKALNLSS